MIDSPPSIELESFEHVEGVPGTALLRIAGRLRASPASPGPSALVIDDGLRRHRVSPLPGPPDAPGTFRVAFPVPSPLLGGDARFSLELPGGSTVVLPPPARRPRIVSRRPPSPATPARRNPPADGDAARLHFLQAELAHAAEQAQQAQVRAGELERRLARARARAAELEAATVAARGEAAAQRRRADDLARKLRATEEALTVERAVAAPAEPRAGAAAGIEAGPPATVPRPEIEPGGSRLTRVATGIVAGGVLGIALWGGLALIRGTPAPSAASSVNASPAPAFSTGSPGAARIAASPGTSLVAQAGRRVVPIYRSPSAARPFMTLHNPNSVGAPLVFLVRTTSAGRLRVLLPTRPNLSTGWISLSDVRLALDPYRLKVDLRGHVMVLWRGPRVVERDPVGVGRRALTPTPAGLYYITELLRQPDASGPFGPYAFGLSGHSTVLHEFAGGDGQIGIHGTNQPWAVGTDVSHGCIRVRNAVIRRLAALLPLGTPVEIARG